MNEGHGFRTPDADSIYISWIFGWGKNADRDSTKWVNGRFSYGLYFDGQVSVDLLAYLKNRPTQLSDISVEAFVNLQKSNLPYYNRNFNIIRMNNYLETGSESRSWSLGINKEGKLVLEKSYEYSDGYNKITGNFPLPLNQFSHVGFTYSSQNGGRFRFYIDGNLDIEQSIDLGRFDAVTGNIGNPYCATCSESISSTNFEGIIDEVRISNIERENLSCTTPVIPVTWGTIKAMYRTR